MTIPVSVIVATKNEAGRIGKCLDALKVFDEIVVVDSGSTDDTVRLSSEAGATVVSFTWNGVYPKKRQWCMDNLRLKYDWIFFVDADEIVTEDLVAEIKALFERKPSCAGYFITGCYVIDGRILRFGLNNSKLTLFDRRSFIFPEVNDIGLPGMGEMEGHYQPVFKKGYAGRIGRLKAPLLHYAYNTAETWQSRHRRYAAWEAGMNARNAWPADPVPWRQMLKRLFRSLPLRPYIAFGHSYIWKKGFLEGKQGFVLALDRYSYYSLVQKSARLGN